MESKQDDALMDWQQRPVDHPIYGPSVLAWPGTELRFIATSERPHLKPESLFGLHIPTDEEYPDLDECPHLEGAPCRVVTPGEYDTFLRAIISEEWGKALDLSKRR